MDKLGIIQPDSPDILSIDSVNHLQDGDRGKVVLASSHGGLYCGDKALRHGVRGLVLCDGGVGREQAGIAALPLCDSHDVPAAVVSYLSARIGDVADVRRRGVISHVNAAAAELGLAPGMAVEAALEALRRAGAVAARPATMTETRHEESLVPGAAPVVCIDSATLIRPEDAGRVVVTGSHGGLIGGNPAKAINVDCAFAAFNDAGVGIDNAGIGRLKPLDARGIAAITVGHMSARIGDGRSTLHDGIISHANATALRAGIRVGEPLASALRRWLGG